MYFSDLLCIFVGKSGKNKQKTMYAKYIKREIPDLNGTGRTQAYYQMELTPKSYEEFVGQCAREGNMEESQILAVMSLVSEKLALCIP